MSKKVRLFATQRVTRKAKNGKDALQIIVEPDTLAFDTDENGLVNNSELSGKYAEIRCYRGNTDVTDLCRFFFEDGDNINCNANVLANRVSFTKINTKTIEGNVVSCSNGYVNITIKDESINSHSVQVKFSVNITKFIGDQISNNKKFESKYTKLTAGMSEGSSIIQTAQTISLEVTKSSLKKAGIEITTDQVKLYGDKVQVLTRKDGETNYEQAGMFSNGKLNASLIDADAIEIKHLWAKSEDGTAKVGYFGNTENMDACKVDDTTYAPLFIGANNAKNAPFHVTQDGAIYALMGRIGKFSLTDDGIFEYNDGHNTIHKPMRLSESCLYFTHSTDHTTNDRVIWMGYTISSNYGIHSLVSDIWIDDREYRPTSSKACLLLHAEGGTSEQSNSFDEPSGNFAICASKGMYAGFRPVTRRVNKSITLSEMDCFIIVTKGVTLTLPSKPQRGQYYKFIQAGNNFTIKSSINNMFWNGASGKNSFTSDVYNKTTELIYDGSNWHVNWFRESVA